MAFPGLPFSKVEDWATVFPISDISEIKQNLNKINTYLHKGGTMVPNIWFFGSRILTPQYFGLIIFVIA